MKKPPQFYKNPLGNITGIGDPFILKHNDMYYLYGTTSPQGFKVWESPNLIDWELKGLAFDKNVAGNNWGIKSFWAPEIIFYQNKCHMVYSARTREGNMKIALAQSEHPLGPFMNVKTPLFNADDPYSYIDGHIFIDDGTPYLYFVKDCSKNIVNGVHKSQIYVQEMSKDLFTLKGHPVLAIQPDQIWEGINKDKQWNEGPFVIKHNRQYYLMYSANYYRNHDYSIGYATASSPMGPWEKYEGNPILAANPEIGVSGPGHNSIINSPDDSELFIVYHAHVDPDNPSGNRNLNLDRLYFDDDDLKIQGPTRTFQPAPNGVAIS